MKSLSIEEINEVLNGTIVGSITTKITAPEQLEVAKETEISSLVIKNMRNYGLLQKHVLQL